MTVHTTAQPPCWKPWPITVTLALVFALLFIPAAAPLANAQCDPPERHYLEAPDAYDGDGLGYAVDIDQTLALAGAPFDDDFGDDSGSAYLFDAVSGQFVHKLLADDGSVFAWFGMSVAIGSGRAMVGAPTEAGGGINRGSVYVFDGTTGSQLHKLNAQDGQDSDYFGISLAADGTTAIIGAVGDDDLGDGCGSAYLFDIVSGDQLFKLLPDDGAADDDFGISVAISGNRAIVGSHYDDDNGDKSGSAYLFDAATGDQLAKLLPDDGAEDDWFGHRVAISGDTAIVTAPRHVDSGYAYGAAYIFSTVDGSQLHKLQIPPRENYLQFGVSVATDGSMAMIGAHESDYYGTEGEVHLFDVATGAHFGLIDQGWMDQFGHTVACEGSTMMVGAYNGGYYVGSAHIYDPCPTVGAGFTCLPATGTVPFSTHMTATLRSYVPGQTRRIAGRLLATLANGTSFGSWRAGFTNVPSTGTYVASWNQGIPALMSVVGENRFELFVEDITPAPYNQPPWLPSGDTDTAVCTVTGMHP